MIRHAQFGDVPKCVELIKKANELSRNYRKPFNNKKVYDDLMIRVMNPYSLILVNEDISGLLVGAAVEYYFYNYKVMNEFFYAEKQGLSFIREYKRWGQNWGDDTIIEIDFSFGDHDRAKKVLEYEGFRDVGPQMRLM